MKQLFFSRSVLKTKLLTNLLKSLKLIEFTASPLSVCRMCPDANGGPQIPFLL